MKPIVKVLIVVAVVLSLMYLLKTRSSGYADLGFLSQEFETVPPSQPFIVSNVPLVVSAPHVMTTSQPLSVPVQVPVQVGKAPMAM